MKMPVNELKEIDVKGVKIGVLKKKKKITKGIVISEDIYVSSDGKEFTEMMKAVWHEENLIQKRKEDACVAFRQTVVLGRAGDILEKWTKGPVRATVFHITNAEDLKIFCEGYRAWDDRFCNFESRRPGPYPKDYVFLECDGIPNIFLEKEDALILGSMFSGLATAWEDGTLVLRQGGASLHKYRIDYVDGHTLCPSTYLCEARNKEDALEKLLDAKGNGFEHHLKNIFEDGKPILEN